MTVPHLPLGAAGLTGRGKAQEGKETCLHSCQDRRGGGGGTESVGETGKDGKLKELEKKILHREKRDRLVPDKVGKKGAIR